MAPLTPLATPILMCIILNIIFISQLPLHEYNPWQDTESTVDFDLTLMNMLNQANFLETHDGKL